MPPPPPVHSTTSIPETKLSFLRSQTRLLSAPIHPSPSWQDQFPNTGDDNNNDDDHPPPPPLPEKVLTDLLAKVNMKIKAHNRLVFSAQSQRHVAEQIDAWYWSEVVSSSSAGSSGVGENTVWVNRDLDLGSREGVDSLPDHITIDGDDDNDDEGDGDNGIRSGEYERLKAEVDALVERRDELKTRVERYRSLRESLAALEDPVEMVQPNLVGRDGEVSGELERMRVLVARVEGGLRREESRVRVKRGSGSEGMDVNMDDGRQKLKRVLELG